MPSSSSGFILRLSAFYAASFALIGVLMPFFPLWLAARGLDAATIGVVLAAPAFVRIGAVPFFTRMADRHGALREGLMAASLTAAAFYVAIGFADGAVAILIIAIIAAIAQSPIVALADALALRGLRVHRGSYGGIRLWGSLAFIAANLGAGLLLDFIAPEHLILVIAAAAIAAALAGFFLVAPQGVPNLNAGEQSHAPLWRNPAFLAVIAGAGTIQASHALYYAFTSIHWQAAGFDGFSIGLLWAIGVLAEIVLFALSRRFPSWLTQHVLLLIGAGGGTIRWFVMAFDPPGWSLPLLQCLHAASFGCTHLGLIGYIARHAPERYAATAQGHYVVASGVSLGVATALAGFLYERYAGAGYAGMALIALFGGLIILLARAAWPQAFRTNDA